MKNKDLQELLQKYPDDMDVVISHFDGYERCYTWDMGFLKGTLDCATYTSKFQSNMEEYDLNKDFIEFVDEIEGEKSLVRVPTFKKEVVILEV